MIDLDDLRRKATSSPAVLAPTPMRIERATLLAILNTNKALIEALDPDTLLEIADDIDSAEYAQQAMILRVLAAEQRSAIASAKEPKPNE